MNANLDTINITYTENILSCLGSQMKDTLHIEIHDGMVMGAINNNNAKRLERKEKGNVRLEILKISGSEVHGWICRS